MSEHSHEPEASKAIRKRILDAIRSSAVQNGGRPLGARAFQLTTGLSRTDFWNAGFARYGDAVKVAGLVPNQLQTALDTSQMLSALAVLTRQLGRFPSISDLKAARSSDSGVPSYEAYFRLSGGAYSQLPALLLQHCRTNESLSDVVGLLDASRSVRSEGFDNRSRPARVVGYVYLAKHGRDFKIGRSNDTARRRREVALLLPHELEHVHVIETDDPEGIERYWHGRFAHRRVRGEWFRLTREDVAAFKRRRYQ